MPFLENEDAALKLKLQGLSVRDATSGDAGRKLTVRFRSPEYELADATYPLALLQHTAISRDSEREMRGPVKLGYAPEGHAVWSDYEDPTASPYFTDSPIPLNIDYQVDFYTRKQQHLIQLTGALMSFDLLSERFGYLAVSQDSTVRRLDVLGGPEFSESSDELGKRLFTAAYALRVSSEAIWADIVTAGTEVQRVFVDVLPFPAAQETT